MTTRPLVPGQSIRGSRGAVVTAHHLATAAGLQVLADGGHAVDAAIAANACLAVVVPFRCGIGGDAFWLIWDQAAGAEVALNGSGRAPAAASSDALRAMGHDTMPFRGPHPITVPGAVRSWGDAHRRYGRLSPERILAPAIELAERGFPASQAFSSAVERSAEWATAVDGAVGGLVRRLSTGGPALARGRDRPAAGPGRDPVAAGQPRVRRLLRRRPGRADGGGSDPCRQPHDPRRPALAYLHLGRADRHRLPRGPHHDAPAQQPGVRGPRDPGDPRSVRTAAGEHVPRGWAPRPGLAPSRDRGRQARDARPGQPSHRSGVPACPDHRPARAPIDSTTSPRGSTRPARPRRPRARHRSAAGRCGSASPTAMATR